LILSLLGTLYGEIMVYNLERKNSYKKDGRILGLDVGDKSLGVAISDISGKIATGLEGVKFSKSSMKEKVEYVKKVAVYHKVGKIVMGLPVNLKGEEGHQAEKIHRFAEDLSSQISIPVVFFDERFSSVAAEKVLKEAKVSLNKRKKVRDKLAATIILQNYLDTKCI